MRKLYGDKANRKSQNNIDGYPIAPYYFGNQIFIKKMITEFALFNWSSLLIFQIIESQSQITMIFMLKQVRLGQEGRHTPAILCKMSLALFRHFHFRSRSFSRRKTIFALPHKTEQQKCC